jgi:FAD/FMN-containing dehydrogenase
MTSRLLRELTALDAAIEGSVAFPGSPDYAHVRPVAWAQFEAVEHEAAVLCQTPHDVEETLALARRLEMPIGMRSGGHCIAGRSSTSGILLDVGPMRSVSVADGIATVGAGAQLGEIYDRLDDLGLTIVAGSCPSVGIAGLTLGGGLGFVGRKYGLTSDQLVEAQVVLADGRIVDCDERREPDLFWALRGAGGGQFGVVTSFRFSTVPAENLTCFKLVWPYRHAAELTETWQQWSPDAVDELAASLLFQFSDASGEPIATLVGTMLGSEQEAASMLDELATRVGAEPVSAFVEEMSNAAAKRYLAPGASAEPDLVFIKSEFFREPLPSDTIAALIDAFGTGREPGQARELDFTPWRGAYNRLPAEATAFAHRGERFLLKHAVALARDASPGEREAGREWLARSWAIVHPGGSGGVFPNFPDPDLDDWERAYHGVNYERLTRVKAAYDPDGVFSFHQSVPPASR